MQRVQRFDFSPATPSRRAGALTPSFRDFRVPQHTPHPLLLVPRAAGVHLLHGGWGVPCCPCSLCTHSQCAAGLWGATLPRVDCSVGVTFGTLGSQVWRRKEERKAVLNTPALAAVGSHLAQRASWSARVLTWTCSPWPAWSTLPSACIFGELREVEETFESQTSFPVLPSRPYFPLHKQLSEFD